MGTWLLSVIAATLAIPFVAQFVVFSGARFAPHITARLPVLIIAAFGMVFCVYALVALLDVRWHIESNWRRAAYARTGEWKPASLTDRKRHGWRILLVVGVLAFVAFLGLLVVALLS